MISVQEAEKIINQHTLELQSEVVSLKDAMGWILVQQLVADRDFPPYHRVTMDGIAIRHADWEAGTKQYQVIGIQPAGAAPLKLDQPGQALEVMTGAVLPDGADTVIPYEMISIDEAKNLKIATINTEVSRNKNVHPQGSDRLKETVIVQPGAVIGPSEIGIAATVGCSRLEVLKPPSVAIISTGDELVGIDETPLPHQIRSSNAATLQSALKSWQIEADCHHLNDDLPQSVKALESLIKTYQVLIFSGGVSKGKFDFIPQALEEVQVKKEFHRIKQRPGKPFWFGAHESGTVVFAFPGNPVSSFMCFNRYLKPWLNREMGIPSTTVLAHLTDSIEFTPELTYFAQVKLNSDQGKIYAAPAEGHGSGDLANLVDADGFMELPPDRQKFHKGELYPVYRYR